MGSILAVEGVARTFGTVRALDGVSMSLGNGEILGLIGPNGAGKSTLLNVISGFLRPDFGRVLFEGDNLVGHRPDEISRRGVVRTFQILRLIREMSVLDNLLLAFRDQPGETVKGLFLHSGRSSQREENLHERARAMLAEVGLAEKMHDPAATLSYGQQKLLSLACCLAAEPKVVLLDEPAAGLSPAMLARVMEIIRDLPSQGRSTILIEHNMEVIEKLCSRVVFLSAGRKMVEGTLDDLRRDQAVMVAYLG